MNKIHGFLLYVLLLRSATAGPGKPEVIIGLNTEAIADNPLGGIEPIIKWSASQRVGKVDLIGGVNLKVENKSPMPYSLWGIVKRSIGEWDLSARIDTSSSDLSSCDVDLQAVAGSTALQVKGKASTSSKSGKISNLKLAQKLRALGGVFTLVPQYNLDTQKPDLRIAYGIVDTTVVIDASLGKQKITLSQRIGDKKSVTHSITTDGDVELEYSRALANGILTTIFRPNDSLDLKWQDGPWQATCSAPLTGLRKFKDGIKVNVRRSVDVL
jgi:hypothetical protein